MNVPLIFLASCVFFALLVFYLARRRNEARPWEGKMLSGRLWALLIVGPLLVLALAIALELGRQHRTLVPFQPYLDEYLYLPGEKAGNAVLQMNFTSPTGSPYIRGKVIPVQVRDNTLDILYFDLPKDLRAGSPEEVGTVVWLYCVYSTQKIEFAAGAKRETNNYTCDVAVIDFQEQTMVAKQSFQKVAGGQGIPDVLYPDIIEYLSGLPRR